MASTPTNASPPSLAEVERELSGQSRDNRKDWQRRRSATQLVKDARTSPRLPAGLDANRNPSGRFVKGHLVRSGGTRKRKSLKTAMEEALLQPGGTDICRKMAARAVGCEVREVPHLDNILDLQAWVRTMRSLAGCIEDFREIGDRVDPKPQRITLDASLTAKRAPISGGTTPEEAVEAERYYQMLAAGSEEDEAPDEFEDVDFGDAEPVEDADLSFLE